jgi:PAS domain S-box-containing protein
VDQIAIRESRTWILALVVLLSLAIGFAAVSYWQGGTLMHEWRILPVALVVLVVLFCVYVWSKSTEMAELRGLVRGLERRENELPDLEQLEKVFGRVQRSQQGYRELIDTFEDSLFSISLDGEILAVNRSCADLLGQPFSALVGRPLDEFVDLPDATGRASAQSALPRLMERRNWSGVLRLRLKSTSSVRFFQCSVHVLVRSGQDFGVGVLARDITQQKENEARFTELFETLQEGVYVADGDGRLTDVNPALVLMLGYDSRQELRDRPLQELFHEPAEWETQQRQMMTSSGTLQGREIVLRGRDGSAITCLHNAAVIRDAGGKISRLQGTFVNITARREVERRLHQQQEFARRLVGCFPDLVVALDADGRCTFVSPRCKELTGFKPEEMVGRRLAERLDPRDRAEFESRFDAIRASAGGEGPIMDVLLESRNGEMRLFRTTASPLLSESGEVEGTIVSMRDFTDAKRIEQQLIQSERLAAMGQMIAGVAHELNNPLTAVLGVTEMLKDSVKDQAAHRHLDLAHAQARRAAQIVQSLLSFARPPHPRKTRLQLDDVIERSLQFHERSLRASNITVDFARKPDVPAVLGDPSQLTQVFLNLIINAEQAIREIRGHGTLRIRVAKLGDQVVATFQDDGVGIRRDILPKIFDPFFTTKRPGRGTGLGLSICLAVLREHYGQIEAQPFADGGSVFTVSMPVAKGTDLVLADPVASRASAAPSGSPAGCSLLVVDDEESIREMVRDGLTSRGVRVEVASSGEEALCLMESRSYDVVLCDLNLKPMVPSAISGQELFARATRLAADVPQDRKPLFIFMTGDLAEQTAIEDSNGEKVRTLQKPFRISELAKLLTEVLAASPLGNPQTSKTV